MSASRFSLTLSFRADAAPPRPAQLRAQRPHGGAVRAPAASETSGVAGGADLDFFPDARFRAETEPTASIFPPPSQKAQLAKEKAAKGQNKQRFPKGKATLDIADWLKNMEAAQVLDGDNVKRSGHTYAKNKFETKEQFDAAKGRTAAEAKAKKPGFLNW